jgi:hypothetical protein
MNKLILTYLHLHAVSSEPQVVLQALHVLLECVALAACCVVLAQHVHAFVDLRTISVRLYRA